MIHVRAWGTISRPLIGGALPLLVWAAALLVSVTALADDGEPSAGGGAELELAAHAPEPADEAPCRTLGPKSAEGPSYQPFMHFEFSKPCMALQFPVSVQGTVERVSPYVVDRDGFETGTRTTFAPRVRVGARFDSGYRLAPFNVHAAYEHDLLTGFEPGSTDLEGEGFANGQPLGHELRKAYARVALGPVAHLSGGLMTSHWGLGLLANDGDHGWTPGSARFSDPRGGDRVLRAMFGTGPHRQLGMLAVAGVDLLYNDDVLLDGDRGYQFVMAWLAGHGHPYGGGLYAVRRHQQTAEGRATEVWVLDATARAKMDFDAVQLSLEMETAVVIGDTELAPRVEQLEHKVLQYGLAARATLDAGKVGTVLDVLYASGDQNLDDGVQNAFKADPNYEMGLLLFRQVLANQTARGVHTAGDPDLVGHPADDLERIATRGSATNTLAVFPRISYRPITGLEVYGGPLLAFSAVPLIDPFNTRIAGGAQRNALNDEAGTHLGTEFDLGLRYRAILMSSELTVGLELGALRPGSALQGRGRLGIDTVYGVRSHLRYRF